MLTYTPPQPQRRARLAQVARACAPALALVTLWAASSGGGCSCEDAAGGGDQLRVGANPILEVQPGALNFSSATPDNPETQTLTLTNIGEGDLKLLDVRLEQLGSTFTFDGPPTDTLPSERQTEITVTYTPDDDIADSGTLIIEGSNNQRAAIPLNAIAPRRQLQCIPDPISFNGVELGQTDTLSVRLQNIGNLPLTLQSASLEFGRVFSITQEPDAGVLDPEDSVQLELAFSPEFGGREDDTLRIVIEESPGLFECRVQGVTPLPTIALSPNRIDFGNVPVGQTVTETVTVSNTGEAPLRIEAIDFLRDSSEDFDVASDLQYPVEVLSGSSVEVEFSYTASNDTATGTAVFLSNDPTQPQAALPLLGRPSKPDLVVSPTALNFGEVGQGISVTRNLSLFNNGSEPLEVSSLTIDGNPEFTITADPAFPPSTGGGAATMAPQQEVILQLRYTPTDLGSDLATLLVRSNDPEDPTTRVPLTAIGGAQAKCRIRVRPDPLNFGLVTRGSTKVVAAQVSNVGTGFCRFDEATAAGNLNTFYRLDATSVPRGGTFGPGEVLTVGVAYNPLSINFVDNGLLGLRITDPIDNTTLTNTLGDQCQQGTNPLACGFGNNNFLPFLVPLQGFSGVSDIAVIPGSIDFGLVTLGCSSQTSTITIYNTGVAELQVSNIALDAAGCDEFQLRAIPPLPANIRPEAPVTFQVIYTPTSLGRDFCNILITSNASESEPLLRVPVEGEGTNLSRQIDTFEQVSGRKVDVLFAIDASGSMSEEQDNVASNLQSFLATAQLLNNDFHIAVIQLDLGESKRYGGREYEAGQMIGVPAYMTPNTPNYSSELAARVRLGADGGVQEAGLEAARQALSDPYITQTSQACRADAECDAPYDRCVNGTCGGANAGFLRDDASLEIIMLSDEEDQSSATPEFYTDFFRSIKGFRNDSLLNISVIVGADSAGNPGTCSSSDGDAEGGRRYAAVSDATGGTVGSICANDFGPYLQNIGNRAFGLRVEFFLSRAAEPATVQVRVNDQPRNTGWTYDPNTNSVVFDRASVPQPGDEIEVEYEARCF
jgi:hypothetical protein